MRLAALALIVLAALAPTLAAQEPARCELRGHLSIAAVHVVGASGRVSVAAIEDRDVRVTPLGRGFFTVRTHGAGVRIEGRTQSAVPIALAAEHTYGDIARIASGTRADEVEPIDATAFRATFALHDGVSLRRVIVQCHDLAAAMPTDAALDSVAVPRGPSWRARVWRLRLRGTAQDDAAPMTVELTPEARARTAWIERERHAGWARVEAVLAHAHLTGWVHDTDLSVP